MGTCREQTQHTRENSGGIAQYLQRQREEDEVFEEFSVLNKVDITGEYVSDDGADDCGGDGGSGGGVCV
jgi:hypothetical protein